MATTYIGTPNLALQITIPDDGDNAAAASVNNPTKAEADMDFYLLQSYANLPESTCPITLSCSNLTTVTISPLPYVLVLENGVYKTLSINSTSSVGVANIEGAPGAYTASVWYFIYIYSALGVPSFQISQTPPDAYKLYKNGDDSFKYIGSFRTTAAALINNFYATRGIYTYLTPQAIGGGSSTSSTVLPAHNYISPISKQGMFYVAYANTSGVNTNYRIDSFAGLGYLFNIQANTPGDIYIETSTDNNSDIRYQVGSVNINLQVSVVGYIE